MRRVFGLFLVLAAATATGAVADQVVCESNDSRQVECPMDTRGRVWMVRQLSRADCIEGRTWGLFKHSVWVRDGCRAEFASEGGDNGYGSGDGYGSGASPEVTCESIDNRRVECAIDTSGRVRMVRRLSNAACIENSTWGTRRGLVWVQGGCRAVFTSDGGSWGQGPGYAPGQGSQLQEVMCDSSNGRRVECELDTSGRIVLVRTLSRSPCVEGDSWGMARRGVWVSNGCRGVFRAEGGVAGGRPGYGGDPGYGNGGYVPDPSRETTCESNDNRRTECSMDTSGRVRMVRRLSNSPCIEGSTWGARRGAVWVSNGCRAVFRSDGGGYGSGGSRPPDAAVRGCNAVEDWYGTLVRSTAMRPGYWELILQYTDGQYVCEVDGSGRVSRFEKLRR